MTGNHFSKNIKKASLVKAEKIVNGYKIVIEPHEKFGYVGSALEFPTGFGTGKTREECLADTRECLTVAVAIMLDLGGTPPEPAATQERTAQINIRVTEIEKDLMRRTAAHFGYKSLGDFVRTAAMSTVQSALKNLVSVILTL